MFAILFGVVILWVLFSLGTGVFAVLLKGRTNEQGIATAVTTLRLPYDVVVKLFK